MFDAGESGLVLLVRRRTYVEPETHIMHIVFGGGGF